MEMRYFAEFDNAGECTAGYIADVMPYIEADIRRLYQAAVEISVDDQELYVTGRYIRGENGKAVERPVIKPALDDFKLDKLQQIDIWTAQAITGGFVSAAAGIPHRYDSEAVDQKNLMMM